jgi:hypothetical protein
MSTTALAVFEPGAPASGVPIILQGKDREGCRLRSHADSRAEACSAANQSSGIKPMGLSHEANHAALLIDSVDEQVGEHGIHLSFAPNLHNIQDAETAAFQELLNGLV